MKKHKNAALIVAALVSMQSLSAMAQTPEASEVVQGARSWSLGRAIGHGFGLFGRGTMTGVKKIGKYTYTGVTFMVGAGVVTVNAIWDGSKWVAVNAAGEIWDGSKWVAGKTIEGAQYVQQKGEEGLEAAGDAVVTTGEAIGHGAVIVGKGALIGAEAAVGTVLVAGSAAGKGLVYATDVILDGTKYAACVTEKGLTVASRDVKKQGTWFRREVGDKAVYVFQEGKEFKRGFAKENSHEADYKAQRAERKAQRTAAADGSTDLPNCID